MKYEHKIVVLDTRTTAQLAAIPAGNLGDDDETDPLGASWRVVGCEGGPGYLKVVLEREIDRAMGEKP